MYRRHRSHGHREELQCRLMVTGAPDPLFPVVIIVVLLL